MYIHAHTHIYIYIYTHTHVYMARRPAGVAEILDRPEAIADEHWSPIERMLGVEMVYINIYIYIYIYIYHTDRALIFAVLFVTPVHFRCWIMCADYARLLLV